MELDFSESIMNLANKKDDGYINKRIKYERRVKCSSCEGRGLDENSEEECRKCEGKGRIKKMVDIDIKIPRGVDDG